MRLTHQRSIAAAVLVAVCATLGAGLVVWLGGAVAAAQSASVLLSVQLPDRPTAGARVFVQKSCARCHSLGDESGETRIGPNLGRVLFSGTVMDLAGAFWNHAPVMHEKMRDLKIVPPSITSSDMADLVALLTAYRYYQAEVVKPGNPATGKHVFTAKGCAGCHDPEARQWQGLGPGLQKYHGRSSGLFLAQAMWNHSLEMGTAMRTHGVAFPTFAPGEMDDLVAYLQADSIGREQPIEYFEPGSPRRGLELFSAKGCISCHAVWDRGGTGGPDLGLRGRELVASVPTIAGIMWNHSQTMAEEFKRRGVPRVTFSGQEMVDVIAYLYFINYATVRGTPARGAKLVAVKCATCHAPDGRGVAPDLATLPHLEEPFAIIAAMWNHASKMANELDKKGLAWPKLENGDAADLAAYLVSNARAGARASREP